MGIGAVGARRKLFCAIQRLTSQPLPRRWNVLSDLRDVGIC
jgi:hypothetical protein